MNLFSGFIRFEHSGENHVCDKDVIIYMSVYYLLHQCKVKGLKVASGLRALHTSMGPQVPRGRL